MILTPLPLSVVNPREAEVQLLLWLYNHAPRQPHRVHVLAMYVSSALMHDYLGDHYLRFRDRYLVMVDDHYSNLDHLCRAYVFSDEGRAAIQEALDTVPVELPRVLPREEARDVLVKIDLLDKLCFDYDYAEHWPKLRFMRTQTVRTGPGEGTLREIYRRSAHSGRRFAKGFSLQQLPKKLRHLLVHDDYVDVDMSNAHPAILAQLVGADIDQYPAFASYAVDREAHLAAICGHYGVDRAAAKKAMLAALNGGRIHGGSVDYALGPGPDQPFEGKHLPFVVDFIRDVDRVSEDHFSTWSCYQRRAWESVFAKERDQRWCWSDEERDRRMRARAMIFLVQEIEDEVLQACEAFHAQRGESVDVLLFDGYLVRTMDPLPWAATLERIVEERTGFRLRFKTEPVTQSAPC